jgi:hypothetical protein
MWWVGTYILDNRNEVLLFTTNVLWHTEDKDYIVLDHPHLPVGKWVGNFPNMAIDYACLTQIVS